MEVQQGDLALLRRALLFIKAIADTGGDFKFVFGEDINMHCASPDLVLSTAQGAEVFDGSCAGGTGTAEEGASFEEAIADTGRLFLRNLPYSATETDLSELFGPHGNMQEVHLVLDK